MNIIYLSCEHAGEVRNSAAMKKQRANKFRQYSLFKKQRSDHGGSLRTKRSGRGARPLALKRSMHLILRSTLATGEKSFRKSKNEKRIVAIIKKFSQKHAVKIINFANVGNHLHFQIQLGSRLSYKPFIRAVTGAIALAIGNKGKKFWDQRPFTRIAQGFKDSLRLSDYIAVNRLESLGVKREQARVIVDLSSA